LASLELKDPSKVQKVTSFEGCFNMSKAGGRASETIQADLSAQLCGFEVAVKGASLVEQMFEQFKGPQVASQHVQNLLEEYLQVERHFVKSAVSKQPYDELLRDLAMTYNGDKFLSMMIAHNKLADRHELVMAIMRQMVAAEGSGMSCMYVPDIAAEMQMDCGVFSKVSEIARMPTGSVAAGDYGTIRYMAQQLLDVIPHESFEDRIQNLREQVGSFSAPWTKNNPSVPTLMAAFLSS
jgi:hypothetical protein